jgi:hypothetical protein
MQECGGQQCDVSSRDNPLDRGGARSSQLCFPPKSFAGIFAAAFKIKAEQQERNNTWMIKRERSRVHLPRYYQDYWNTSETPSLSTSENLI